MHIQASRRRNRGLKSSICIWKDVATHRVVGEVRRGGCGGRTVIVVFWVVVAIRPTRGGSLPESLTVPFVEGVSVEVPEIPEVAQVPKITEVALLVVAAHVISFASKLPRHRRRILLL